MNDCWHCSHFLTRGILSSCLPRFQVAGPLSTVSRIWGRRIQDCRPLRGRKPLDSSNSREIPELAAPDPHPSADTRLADKCEGSAARVNEFAARWRSASRGRRSQRSRGMRPSIRLRNHKLAAVRPCRSRASCSRRVLGRKILTCRRPAGSSYWQSTRRKRPTARSRCRDPARGWTWAAASAGLSCVRFTCGMDELKWLN